MQRAQKYVHKPGYKFPVEKRIEVVTKWLALGNMRLVADLTGVSYQLCRMWKQEPWWQELVDEVKASRTRQLDDKLSKIVDKSLAAIEDRLEHGDFYWNKSSGTIERKPVALKEVTKVANDLLTRQAVLQKLEQEKVVHKEEKSVKDQLAMLALEFAKFNKTNTGPVQDAVILGETNALHDERETRLQEGSSEVYFQTSGEEEEGGAECSPSGDDESGEGSQG